MGASRTVGGGHHKTSAEPSRLVTGYQSHRCYAYEYGCELRVRLSYHINQTISSLCHMVFCSFISISYLEPDGPKARPTVTQHATNVPHSHSSNSNPFFFCLLKIA